MHIVANLKILAPFLLYMAAIICAILAFSGQVRWAVLCIVILSPLRNVVERFVEFPLGNQVLDVLYGSMLFGWLVSSVFLRAKFAERSSINLISITLIFYTFISVCVSNQYLYDDFGLKITDSGVQDAKNFCLLPILYFLTLNGIKDKKWVHRTFMVMCAVMLLMGYYTFYQIMWYSSLESRSKITGTFQFLGPNEVAAFYNTNTIVMIGIYFYMKKGLKKMILLGLIVLNMFCMIFMYSRAAYAATFVGLFMLFALKNKKYLIPLILVAVFWQVALPEKARERIVGTKNVFGDYDESTARRLSVWDEALNIFQKSPLVGIGYGSFRHIGADLKDTHNIYIKIAVEQGIVGLSIFGILLLCFIKEGYKLYKKGEDDESKGLGLGFMVMVFVIIVNNIFGDRWSYYELAAYWWVFAGLVARLNALNEQANVQPLVTSPANSAKMQSVNSSPTPRRKSPVKKVSTKFKRSI